MSGNIKVDKLVIAAVLLAIIIRLGIIWSQPVITPYFETMTALENVARNLVEGHGYTLGSDKFVPFYQIPPGTSTLLAGTYWICGQYKFIYLRIIQAIIDSLGCLLIFLVARELFGRRVGLISAFLYAVWLPIAYLSTWPLQDALMPFITLVCLYFFVMGVKRKALKFYILSGLFTGIGCYFQPTILLLPLFFGLGLLIYNWHKSHLGGQIIYAAKVTAVSMAVLVLVITPWIVRNYHVTGSVIVMRPGPWSGLWEGFEEFGENPVGAKLSDNATYQLAREELGYDVEYMSPAYQAFFKPKVLNAIKEYPGWYAGLVAKRIPRAIFNFSELGIHNFPLIRADYPVWLDYLYAPGLVGYVTAIKKMFIGMGDGTFWTMLWTHPYGAFYFVLVWGFALIPPLLSIYAFWIDRKNWRSLVLIATVPAYFIVIHIFTFVASYKSIVPASLGYIIFSAIALGYIYGRIKGKTTADKAVAKSLK
jgi:4-amino-4-deoxy-L-arabinose transferase-like glycosyltransferase